MVQKKKSAYLLFNEMNSRYRFRAAKYVVQSGYIPMYPTIVGDFFDQVVTRRQDKDTLIRNCEELWVFGDVTTQMNDQVIVAKRLGKRVRFFAVENGEFSERVDERRVKV